ncbi:MAG: hypothetical protein U1E21_15505 [Reyranellaceae bacterium]
MKLFEWTQASPLRLVFVANIAFIALLELAMAPWYKGWAAASTFLLLNFALGGAAGFSGGLLGFIFGVPRPSDSPSESAKAYRINTNLVQISDWLTKLLVGAGLASLGAIPGFAVRFIAYLDEGAYKGLPGGGTFALFLLIYYLSLGFFWGYVETRTYLTDLLDKD